MIDIESLNNLFNQKYNRFYLRRKNDISFLDRLNISFRIISFHLMTFFSFVLNISMHKTPCISLTCIHSLRLPHTSYIS